MISRMWQLTVPAWALVLRSVVVYSFLICLLRLTGKRQVGQLAPFDLVLLLILSNAVQNAMNSGDNSIVGGMISAVTLVGVNWIVGLVTYKSKIAERLVEGTPELLVHNGKIAEGALRWAKMTQRELLSALREAGCADVAEVRAAFLENDGSISVIPRKC